MTPTRENQVIVRPGAVTLMPAAAAPPKPKKPRLVRPVHLALVAGGFGVMWASPDARLLIDGVAMLGFALAVPVLALLTVLGFVADFSRLMRGRPAAFSWGARAFAAMWLCLVGATVYTPPGFCSPVMLDLKGNGAIGTTGDSTARQRAGRHVGRTVSFDLAAVGTPQQIEWSNGDGAGFLVDDRDGMVARTGRIDGSRLFGDQGGKYASGYDKLALLDADGDGQLKGAELAGLAVWIDDGDARIEAGELQGVGALGVEAIGVKHHAEINARGGALDRSWFSQRGRRKLTEDVWFGVAPGSR